ncbi:MFS general substrate transporter [Glarea lozoyensis ATCC 20868]|uniref:MFS general substrate transporter n=1 Tax=Glarea lozoyensis (strain ATCC 20868 / MF5171) TaxID=1116229 RepID=S3CLY2_GLAL2|nr:MFS general substrate transporter [Glarea lozoyensis ATCC 20868]EPE27512.1 MFS general substrate transporter [Glarea lozoyensis ATCC 20868]
MPNSIELIQPYPTLHPHHHHHHHDIETPKPQPYPTLDQTPSISRASYSFPEGGTAAWLVILGSFSIIAGTFGLISSVGLFQSYWQSHQLSSYTSRDLGWIGAVNVFLNLLLGVQIGPLFDRYGPRWLIAVGSVAFVGSLVLLAECKVYWHFMLVYGVLGGSASAFLTTTALSVVAHCKCS